jgi:hypothetical protein
MRLLLVAMLGCSPASSATVVEVPPEPLPTASVTAEARSPMRPQGHRALTDQECAARPRAGMLGCRNVASVRVGGLRMSSPTCVVDTLVHPGDVGQVLECEGGGAMITFDTAAFVGAKDVAGLDVCTGTTFPFKNGCTWQSVQRIRGDASTSLTFEYGEAVASGSGCGAAPCSATARLDVVR